MSGWIPRAPVERPSRSNNVTDNDAAVLNESLGEDAIDMNTGNTNTGNGGGGGANGTNRFGAVRDRLFHVMLVKMALSYHQHVPYFCRRLIEFYFLVTVFLGDFLKFDFKIILFLGDFLTGSSNLCSLYF